MSEPKIWVIIPSYNCMEWLQRCYDSVAQQQGIEFQVVAIDDASTDVTQAPFMQQYCSDHGWIYLHNEINQKCPHNLHMGIAAAAPAPEDIIVLVDGDDFLPHSNVLARVNELYQQTNAWLLYSQYAPHPENTGQAPSVDYPPEVKAERNYRYIGSLFNHMLTFKYKLWERIPLREMQFDDGTWFPVCYDRAIMVPMLEMAGDRWSFVNEVLYCYNAVNPISDCFVLGDEAEVVRGVIGSRPRLPVITDL